MNHTLNSLIPIVRQFALKIEFTNAIVGKIWVLPDDSTHIHDYEFTREGLLYMSLNGNIQVGNWKILPSGRVLIDRISDKIMLTFDFALDGIVIFQKTGINNSPFLLYDKNLIPNGDILSYLEKYQNDYKKIAFTKSNIVHDLPIMESKEELNLIFQIIALLLGLLLMGSIIVTFIHDLKV